MIADVASPYRRQRRTWKRERRLLLAVVGALCLLIYLGSVVYGGATGGTQVVRVHPGDTVWSIAADHYPGDDLRARVDEIISVNHLGGGLVMPGQALTIPAG